MKCYDYIASADKLNNGFECGQMLAPKQSNGNSSARQQIYQLFFILSSELKDRFFLSGIGSFVSTLLAIKRVGYKESDKMKQKPKHKQTQYFKVF